MGSDRKKMNLKAIFVIAAVMIFLGAAVAYFFNYQTVLGQSQTEQRVEQFLNQTNYSQLVSNTIDQCSSKTDLSLLEQIECIRLIEDRVSHIGIQVEQEQKQQELAQQKADKVNECINEYPGRYPELNSTEQEIRDWCEYLN
ncbi:MAG: hypothetical protein WBP83_07905 [Nitrososphaeraceae archaeon]|jgi:hypothetical protein